MGNWRLLAAAWFIGFLSGIFAMVLIHEEEWEEAERIAAR